MSNPKPKPKDRTLFAKLVTNCLRTSCKCSPQATSTSNNDPKHDSACPYTPNRSFQAVNEYRQLKVRTFLNTIIAITPTPTPPKQSGIAHQQDPSIKPKRVTFHASVANLPPPIDENPEAASINHNESGARLQTFNTTTEQVPVPQHITAETIEQLILCNQNHMHSPCPTCTFSEPQWTTYLDNLTLSQPNTTPQPTSWIPLLSALNRATKIWAGQTILHLEGGWESSTALNPPTQTPHATPSKTQIPYPFIAIREQIHLSHALSSLVDDSPHYSARVIFHRLGKLKTQIARAGFHADRIIRLQAVLIRMGMGLGIGLAQPPTQTETQTQNLPGVLLDLHTSKSQYLGAKARLIQELERLSASVGGFRAEVERHLGLNLHLDGQPEPRPNDDEEDGRGNDRFEVLAKTPVSTIRTALHELNGFAEFWPPNSRRRVDLVWKVLGQVHQGVLSFQQEIGAMKLLWTMNGLLIGSGQTLESLVIRPSEIKVGIWYEAARCGVIRGRT